MIVGICSITLAVPAAHSLKEKRSAIKPLLAHVRREFNVAIAEVADQDRWQSSGLAVAAVGPDGANLHGVLEGVVRAIERTQPQVFVTDWQIEIL